MGKMTVFHGSHLAIPYPEIRTSRNTKDFGPGFYCTVLREQAARWAQRYNHPVVNTYTVQLDTSLRILEFHEMTEAWLDFIINCRHGIPHNYDIVIGAMANDQIYNFIADYIDGIITREQFWVMAKFKYPTHQINLWTEAALNCLTCVGSEEVKV